MDDIPLMGSSLEKICKKVLIVVCKRSIEITVKKKLLNNLGKGRQDEWGISLFLQFLLWSALCHRWQLPTI